MGRGIKKISENVIADKRSLTLVTTSGGLSNNTETVDLVGIRDTEAMPLGMLNVNYGNLGLSMKVDTNKWSKLDAALYTLPSSCIATISPGSNSSPGIYPSAISI